MQEEFTTCKTDFFLCCYMQKVFKLLARAKKMSNFCYIRKLLLHSQKNFLKIVVRNSNRIVYAYDCQPIAAGYRSRICPTIDLVTLVNLVIYFCSIELFLTTELYSFKRWLSNQRWCGTVHSFLEVWLKAIQGVGDELTLLWMHKRNCY